MVKVATKVQDLNQLRVTMEQMERLIRALDDLKKTVLPNDPNLFATMAEAPLEDLERLRKEVREYVDELQPAG